MRSTPPPRTSRQATTAYVSRDGVAPDALSGQLARAVRQRAPRAAIQRMNVPKDRTEKKRYDALLELYNANFGINGTHKDLQFFGREDWDYVRNEAEDLDDLDRRVKAMVKKAGEAAAKVKSLPDEPETTSTTTSVTQAPKQQKKKRVKKKKEPPPLSKEAADLQAQILQGFGTGPPITAQVTRPLMTTMNPDIQNLIHLNAKPPGTTLAVDGPYLNTGAVTVYYYLTLTLPRTYPQGPLYPVEPYREMEVHFHPRPTTNNYLHVKRRAGSDAGNVVAPGHWLATQTMIANGRALWNQLNPTNQATV